MRNDFDVRSSDDVAAAVEEFTDADWVRLNGVSNRYAWLYPAGAAALLWEAIGRAVAGTRRCPANVDVVRFLAEAMRSIADGEAKKIANIAEHTSFDEAGKEIADAVRRLDRQPSPEDSMISTQETAALRQAVLGLFADDPVARDVADGIMEGYDGEELRALTDLDKTGFASKRRLIRRRLTKARAEGVI